MKAEPLQIQDKTFLINRLIQQAPTSTLIREFFKNAEENAALAPSDDRRIEIYPVEINSVRKLAFWNTGVGMSAFDLKRATDISSSINKNMALNENFGIGAKVSGLTASPLGIRYRSCKDGEVHQVIIGYDEIEGTYVRFPMELEDGSADTVIDVTGVVQNEGHQTNNDWTEVVLYGESEDHDTVAEPLGKGKRVDRSFVPTTIFQRFARFTGGVNLRVDVAMTKGGGKGATGNFRQVRTLSAILDKLRKHEEIVDQDEGITIRYIHDPKHENSSHNLSARANPAAASTTFCAVVHKGERYDFKTKKAWSAAAPNFGIPFGSKVLTIEIEIPNDMALPTQYRDALTWPHNRTPLVAEDFSDYVRELMPEWVKDVIREESPDSNENLDDLQKDLQSLLDEFRVPTVAQLPSNRENSSPSDPSTAGVNVANPANVDAEFPSSMEEFEANDGEAKNRGSSRANDKQVHKAPDGSRLSRSTKALERVPNIEILMKPEDISEKDLIGRAGRYYKEAQTLFINGLYPIVERMAQELDAELRGLADPELVRKIAHSASVRSMAFRVGKITCFAISKRVSEDWSADDLDVATSPESLSMAADDFRQSISSAKKWAKLEIKMIDVPDKVAV